MLIPAIFIFVLASASIIHHTRMKRKLLTREIPFDSDIRRKFQDIYGVEGVVATGISLFDALYNTTRMNPFTLEGIDHLHNAQEFSNFKDLSDFMKSSIIPDGATEKQWRQLVHKYKGYTGEEMVFDHLENDGVSIEIPESGTEEAVDLWLDGKPFNVKVRDNPAGIRRALDKHPDVDIITNTEMSDAFSDDPRVIIDQDISVQDVFHETSDTFEALDDIGDFIDQIPWITLCISSFRNIKSCKAGNKDAKTAIEHIACDTVAVGVGGWAGGEIGLQLGMALAPITAGISIPVGAFLGSIAGILGGKYGIGFIKQRHLKRAVKLLKAKSAEFCNDFQSKFDILLKRSLRPFQKYRALLNSKLKVSELCIKRWLFPNISSKFYYMSRKKARKEMKAIEKWMNKIIVAIKEKEDYFEGGLLLFAYGEKVLVGDSELLSLRDKVAQAIELVEIEKRKLK